MAVHSGSAGQVTRASFVPASSGVIPGVPGQLIGRGVEQTLTRVAQSHNALHTQPGQRADVRALRAVYRRGARSYAKKPGVSRRQHAMGRVQTHLQTLASGKRPNPRYTHDDDLLPSRHPLAPKQRKVALGWTLTKEGSADGREAKSVDAPQARGAT